MRIERPGNGEEVAQAAADLVQALLAETPDATILLPAGRTPLRLYRELVARRRAGALNLGEAHFFQLDELVGVGPGDERGFQAFLRRELLEPAEIDAQHAHVLDGRADDCAAEIQRHSRDLARVARDGRADLALLGIGRNGHVAFNEPGSSPDERGRVVALSPTTLEGLSNVFSAEELPRSGITLGLSEIMSARAITLIATGGSKATILAELAGGKASPALPASLLVAHPAFRVLADDEAGRLVAGEPV